MNNKPVKQTFELGTIEELIHRRRRQIVVHSCLYYRLGLTLITDSQFDSWAYELARLQKEYPEESKSVLFRQKEFEGFEGITGFDLAGDPWGCATAEHLKKIHGLTP